MDLAKKLGQLIEQSTNDANQQPPLKNYQQILDIINTRVDMPKNTINAISKRLIVKNKKVLYYCFDLLEFLSYRCELALYSQISSKEFLLKISGLLMNQEIDPVVHEKVLQTVRCWEELFRPHEDLLPMFFQFYAGLLRKEFPIQMDYVSKHRPSNFKIYQKKQPKKQSQQREKTSKPVVLPSKVQQKTFEEIREKLILTNEVIDNCNPAQGVKGNDLLLEMMEEIKKCEKRINQTINENPNQKIMQLALALNDDIVITCRRFKDLQKNKRPEPFILSELESDKVNQVKVEKKIAQTEVKPAKVTQDIFSNFNEQPKPAKVEVKKAEMDIFDIACQPTKSQKSSQPTLMDLTIESTVSNPAQNSNVNIFDLLGSKQETSPPAVSPNSIQQNNYIGAQLNNPYQSGFNNPYQSGLGGFQQPNSFQSNNIGQNINLGGPFATQNDMKPYKEGNVIDKLIDLSDFSDFMKKN